MGELEKRIRINFELGDVTYKYTHSENIVITLKDVQDVISEVKQEFPYLRDDDRSIFDLVERRHIWFVKWFGD